MITFEGRARVDADSLFVHGWCQLHLAQKVIDFVEAWLAGHGCSAFPEERLFRVKLGSHQIDHYIEVQCQACKRCECVQGDDFADRLESVRAAADRASGA